FAPCEDSIRRLGPIHPIVVTREHVLIAGERRLRAHIELGYDRINCQYQDEVDEFTLMEIELEENIKRKNLDTREERKSVVDYHYKRRALDPEWNETNTGDKIGMSQQWAAMRTFPLIFSHDRLRDRFYISNDPNEIQRNIDGDSFDNVVRKLRTAITQQHNFDPRKEASQEAAVRLCLENQFHPVLDYLDSLKWDGEPRVDTWLTTYFGAE